MELRNSYIFLSKEHAAPNTDNKLSDLLLEFFPTLTMQDESDPFIYRGFLNNTHVTVEIRETPTAEYCDVIALHHYHDESVKCLEEINRTIMNEKNNFRQTYVPIISFDSVSEYYCNRLHPKLNELDRRLRQLMFQIYISHFGIDYVLSNSFDELLKKMRLNESSDANDVDKSSIETIRSATKALRKFNNKASHCNFFYEKKFTVCNTLVNHMIRTVDEAIDWIDAFEGQEKTNDYASRLQTYTDDIKIMTEQLQGIGDELFEIDKIS